LRVRIYCNSIYATRIGVSLAGAAVTSPPRVRGNAIFSPNPLVGAAKDDNLVGSVRDAANFFSSPSLAVAEMDFFPKTGTPVAKLDLALFKSDLAWNKDFNDMPQDGDSYGAYDGKGANPGWKLALEQK
jgi:hypothetical protein